MIETLVCRDYVNSCAVALISDDRSLRKLRNACSSRRQEVILNLVSYLLTDEKACRVGCFSSSRSLQSSAHFGIKTDGNCNFIFVVIRVIFFITEYYCSRSHEMTDRGVYCILKFCNLKRNVRNL